MLGSPLTEAALPTMSTSPLLRDSDPASWSASNGLRDRLQACSFHNVRTMTLCVGQGVGILNTSPIQLPAWSAALGPLDHSLCASPEGVFSRRFFSCAGLYHTQMTLQLWLTSIDCPTKAKVSLNPYSTKLSKALNKVNHCMRL